MKIERIVFPTDFSEPSSGALLHACEVAGKFGAQLTVLHVQVPNTDDPSHKSYLFFNEKKYADYVKEQFQRVLSRIDAGLQVESEVWQAVAPAVGILHYLEQKPADIVVMGTRGRSALGRFFLGTVAEKVVRHARCPVLTVAPGRENYRDNPAVRRILVPFDFSVYSLQALRCAREFGRRYEAELEALYVVTQPARPSFDESAQVSIRADLSKWTAEARTAFGRTLEEDGLAGVTLKVVVGEGGNRASEEIVAFARETRTDLIVMGTHGLSGIEHVLLGSTTERVVRTAPCPVMTIRRSPA